MTKCLLEEEEAKERGSIADIIQINVSCSVFADLLGKGLVRLGFSRRRKIREGVPRAYTSLCFVGKGMHATATLIQ